MPKILERRKRIASAFLVLVFLIGGCGGFDHVSNEVDTTPPTVTSIAAGYGHTVSLKSDGTIWAGGNNNSGQLGDNTIFQRNTPVQVHGEGDAGFLTDIIAIAAGHSHTLALKSDGTVRAWGNNNSRQLGDNNAGTSSRTPVQVHGEGGVVVLTDIDAIAAAGYGHAVALKSDGTVWAWGYNNVGQLGDNDAGTNKQAPVQSLLP